MRFPITLVLMIAGMLLPLDGWWIVLMRAFVGLGFYSLGFYGQEFVFNIKKWYLVLICGIVFIASALINTKVSMVSSEYGIIPLYICSSITGSFVLIQLSHRLDRLNNFLTRGLKYFGENTLIILCTHMLFVELIRLLDYKLLGNILYNFEWFEGFIFAAIVILFEVPTIYFSNLYLWFLFGKKRVHNS